MSQQQSKPNNECNCKSLKKDIDKIYEELKEIRKKYETIIKVIKQK
jgi:hypothetical protein